MCSQDATRFGAAQRAAEAVPSALGRSLHSCWTLRLKVYCLDEMTRQHDGLAECSKALASGKVRKGVGSKPTASYVLMLNPWQHPECAHKMQRCVVLL